MKTPQLSFKNLSRPSNKVLKSIADFMLYSLPLYLGAILALPLEEETKLWVNAVLTIVIVTIKGLTKFTSEDNPPQNENLDK